MTLLLFTKPKVEEIVSLPAARPRGSGSAAEDALLHADYLRRLERAKPKVVVAAQKTEEKKATPAKKRRKFKEPEVFYKSRIKIPLPKAKEKLPEFEVYKIPLKSPRDIERENALAEERASKKAEEQRVIELTAIAIETLKREEAEQERLRKQMLKEIEDRIVKELVEEAMRAEELRRAELIRQEEEREEEEVISLILSAL